MSRAGFTEQQQIAIREVGRSLLVSAAAGSGKTTVLAERCARLIAEPSDGPPCAVSELLVVTFTDAAAAHMRACIGDALRQRLASGHHPRRRHIEEQLALLPAAPISTIHSFCRDLVRRWFTVAGVDPQADVLDAEEALLLQHETAGSLFEELYGLRTPKALSFQQLVEEDFDGNDTRLVELVLAVHDFARSLPDAEGWLEHVGQRYDPSDPAALRRAVHETRVRRLVDEIAMQRAWLARVLRGWRKSEIEISVQLQELVKYRDALAGWAEELRGSPSPERVDDVCRTITEFSMNASRGRGKSGRKLSEALKARADAFYEEARRRLWQDRLRVRLARFTGDEYADGLKRIAPKLRTLTWLVGEFGRRFAAAKRADNVLDFSDLEQFAFRILAEGGDASRPSDVARRCHQRFRHVLVDEFQDTNPIQEAILTLVSRERSDGLAGNLFAVGDVKQCIYAFRLAEPKLFGRRAGRFRDGREGLLVPLRENFRSRQNVLDAVNSVFERCMTPEFAGICYDRDAALRPGLAYPSPADAPSFGTLPTELHLLEQEPSRAASVPDDGNQAGDEASETVLDWHRVEREAYLIGRRILDFLGRTPGSRRRTVYGPAPHEPGGFRARPIEYRDIVILMRAVRDKAGRLANVLQKLDIPVHADVRGGYFETAELRDMLALLSLLDNGRQDIPLAAVLRSPLAAPGPFSAGDLVRIRVHDRDGPFHVAAADYVGRGEDERLRDRLREFFARVERFRQAARRRSLPDVIADIYEETGYLAYVSGLPHGRQRRANLIGLHDRARQFGAFRRQGLRRFLGFIDQLKNREQDLGTPSAASEADDVVRIMSVHQAKGLEFPVVFVADLGAAINLADVHRPIVMHRDAGIGMKVVDAERNITYPSLAYQEAGEAVLRDTLAEELRILYVAMTRAREHLVLVGSAYPAKIEEALAGAETGTAPVSPGPLSAPGSSPVGGDAAFGRNEDSPQPIETLTLLTARCPLDWLLAAVSRMPSGIWRVGEPEEAAESGPACVWAVCRHSLEDIRQWPLPAEVSAARRRSLARVAAMEPLPPNEPLGADDEVRDVLDRLQFVYEPLAMTTVPARLTVTELKRPFDALGEADVREQAWASDTSSFDGRPRPEARIAGGAARGAERGILTHRFLQCLELSNTENEAAIRAELDRLIEAGRLPAEAATTVDVAAVAAFFAADLGRRLREAAGRVRREVMFVTRMSPAVWDPTLEPHDARDVVLLRGMVDALLPTAKGIELIDYKTDAITEEELAGRVALYRPQVDLYARAVEAIWRRPVERRWLVFLSPGRIVSA